MVWDARPARLASLEVQHALSLEGLSRRFRRVLRADPLRLRLDFSDTRLARRHLAWLALPSWTNRVEALTLYNWPAPASEERSRTFLDPSLCTHGDVVSPLLAVLRAFQCASLRQLLGMPLRQDGVPVPKRMPDIDDVDSSRDVSVPLVDLSMFRLTELGVPSSSVDHYFAYDKLPQTLVSLLYRGSYECSFACRWVPRAAALEAARLPCLSNMHLSGSNLVVFSLNCFPAATGWRAAIEADRLVLVVDSGSVDMPGSMFPGAREVRIDARRVEIQHMTEGGNVAVAAPAEAVLDAVASMLCPPCLERMEIKSGSEFPSIWVLENSHMPLTNRRAWQWVMMELVRAHMFQFAFEVQDGAQKEVGWWRLPAPGTPERDAACMQTAKVLEWVVAEVESW